MEDVKKKESALSKMAKNVKKTPARKIEKEKPKAEAKKEDGFFSKMGSGISEFSKTEEGKALIAGLIPVLGGALGAGKMGTSVGLSLGAKRGEQAINQLYKNKKDAKDKALAASNKAEEQSRWDKTYQQGNKKIGIMQQTANAKMAEALRKRQDDSKNRSRYVPGIGMALTKEDAKNIKDATQMKEKFDSQIGEMISLREEFGGEVANREAVARGKQLSKDLLLTYKNLAKLGVLSQSDEKIINAIIPADPLEFSPSNIVGQDPILTQLQAFQSDSQRDYDTRLKMRMDTIDQTQARSPDASKPKYIWQRDTPSGGSGLINEAHAAPVMPKTYEEKLEYARKNGLLNGRGY